MIETRNYYISDTHFGHGNVIDYDVQDGCRSLFPIEENEALLRKNWNRTVSPKDNIFIHGNFS